MKEYLKNFYDKIFKEKMQKKFFIVLGLILGITLITFPVLQQSGISEIKITTEVAKTTFGRSILEELTTVGVLILSAIVPYMYSTYVAIPIIGLLNGLELAAVSPKITILVLLSILLKSVAYSLAVVIGGILCKKTTIMFKKTSIKNDEIINTKRDLYSSLNNKKAKDKVAQIDKKIKEKMQKLEEEDKKIVLNFQIFTTVNVMILVIMVLSVAFKNI